MKPWAGDESESALVPKILLESLLNATPHALQAVERALADAQLRGRQADTRFRTLFDSARDCIFIKNTELVYTDVNEAMARLFGRPVSELVGCTDEDLFGFEAATEVREMDRRVLAGETIETQHAKPVAGLETVFHVIKVPMRAADGEVVGLCGIARDVTHQRRIVEGLKSREAILSAVAFAAGRFLRDTGMRSLPQVLARLGRAMGVSRAYVYSQRTDGGGGRVASLEARWEAGNGDGGRPPLGPWIRLTGYGLDRWSEVLGRGDIVRAHVRLLPAAERAVLEARGARSVLKVPIFAEDRWWGFIGFDECARERDWLTAEIEALKAAADITGTAIQRQLAADQLRNRFEFERLIASISADFINMDLERIDGGIQRALEGICRFADAVRGMVFLLSEDGHRIGATHEWRRDGEPSLLAGCRELPASDFAHGLERLGRNESIVVEWERDWTPDIARQAARLGLDVYRPILVVPMQSRRALRGALLVAAVPGEERSWTPNMIPLLQFASEVIYNAVERRAGESRLRHESYAFERLAQSREFRIRELERQRAEAEKLAATGRMATRIAHEINNPLAGIKNSFLLIKDAVARDHPYFEYVGRIEREINRIAGIVREMLDLYRPETEAPRHFSAREAVEDVVALLAAEGHHGRKRIHVSLPPGPVEVRLSRGAFVQVLYNLLSNGVDAAPPGTEVHLGVRLAAERMHVRVLDRGPGIRGDVGARMFEPFFTTKSDSSGRGMGLGLSISRTLVDAMGGYLRFRSRAGRGTIFHVILPVDAVAVEVNRGRVGSDSVGR